MKSPTPSKEDRRSTFESAWGQVLAVDTETTGLEVRDGRDYALGASIAWRDTSGRIRKHYFPFRHKYGENYDPEDLAAFKYLIENAPLIVFHNAKFDLSSLDTLGIHYAGRWFDTAVMAYLINENFPTSKELNVLCMYYVGPECHKQKSDELDLFIKAFGWGEVPAAMMRYYGEMDAYITFELAEVLFKKLQAVNLIGYWFEQKMPLMEVVRVMESRGVRIDQEYCKTMVETAEQAMFDYKNMLGGYNPASGKDMNQLLCIDLGLPVIMAERKNKKTGEVKQSQTFDKHAMAEYEIMLARMDEPAAEYILGYRGWQKAATAFYGAYLRYMSPDGRVRPRYRHHKDEDEGGTLTGRLSCAEPNLQQIPKESKKAWNGGVKRSFLPMDGYELWEIDYSQLELRLGTAYAREPHLTLVFAEGRDIFTEMSKQVGLVRQDTKTLVYSMQYGAGIQRIMNALGLSEVKAKEVRGTYFATYPGFKTIADEAKARALRYKEVKLWTGRKRHFVNPRKEAHKALNSIIQGGAADIVERSMIRVYNEVDQVSNNEVRMLLQVHDSIIFEIKKGTAEKWIPILSDIMSDVGAMDPDLTVKFAVEAKPLHERYQG